MGNILNNFPSDNGIVNLARFCFGFNCFTTLPLELFVYDPQSALYLLLFLFILCSKSVFCQLLLSSIPPRYVLPCSSICLA